MESQLETYTYNIYEKGKLLKQFTGQISDFPALKWVQMNQSHSFHWACTYDGWKVELINEKTGEKSILKP